MSIQDVADKRWESGTPHHPQAYALVKALQPLDTNDMFSELGGDGDCGETLAYYLSELIETGKITVEVNA